MPILASIDHFLIGSSHQLLQLLFISAIEKSVGSFYFQPSGTEFFGVSVLHLGLFYPQKFTRYFTLEQILLWR